MKPGGRATPSGATRGRCALCRERREPRLSHIIPEFFFKPLYDEKHRFFVYSTEPAESVERPHQKGFREHLLCDECEGRLSPWEKYAREVFFGGVELECSSDPQCGATAKGVDYTKLKLFTMSLLWRTGVSSLKYFHDVNLGAREKKLRERILAAEPGPRWEYGCSILFPPDPEAQRIFSGAIGPPERLKFKSHRLYRLMLGMTFWLFPVSKRMTKLEANGCHFSLFEDGRLILYNGGASVMEYFYRLAADLRSGNAARGARRD